ncbi:hypothetical protein [Novosphingobium rosa]|uniref:hypothetical protein n=1 Tax=Novosphingobium rosa TaxID=76978 RepID=UPI0012ECF585|nr:hypothetical protein [Novosphingobium rosa]
MERLYFNLVTVAAQAGTSVFSLVMCKGGGMRRQYAQLEASRLAVPECMRNTDKIIDTSIYYRVTMTYRP